MAGITIQGDMELKALIGDLMSEGKKGQGAIRKGMRAAAKIIAARIKETYPKLTGMAAKSVKVRALKRKKGRIGVRVTLFAESTKGFPYPMALEVGAKYQPSGGRVRKAVKQVTVNGRGRRVTDESASKAYHALSWRIPPGHQVEKAFESVEGKAQDALMTGIVEALAKAAK